jgi:hypothetical protein
MHRDKTEVVVKNQSTGSFAVSSSSSPSAAPSKIRTNSLLCLDKNDIFVLLGFSSK